jgi:hypothetical protein
MAEQKSAWDAEKRRRSGEFLAACEFIKRDVTNGYRIDIEADSMVAPDEQAEKQARTEFLTSIMPLLQVVTPQIQGNPAMAPFGAGPDHVWRTLLPGGPLSRGCVRAGLSRARALHPAGAAAEGNTKPPMEIAAEAATARGDQQVDMAKVEADRQKNMILTSAVASRRAGNLRASLQP